MPGGAGVAGQGALRFGVQRVIASNREWPQDNEP